MEPPVAPARVLLELDHGVVGAVQPGGAKLPVMELTRRGNLESKLAAFDAGVQDILTFSFSPEELLARVVAVVRQSGADTVAFTPVIEVGPCTLDILNRTVRSGTSEIRLTSLEQSLFSLRAANAGRVISHDEINDALSGAGLHPESADRQIRNLRARLVNAFAQLEFIATVPGKAIGFSQPNSFPGNSSSYKPRGLAGRRQPCPIAQPPGGQHVRAG